MNCKNCGEEIIECSGKWYHTKGSRWFCSTKKAEQCDTDVGNSVGGSE